MLRATLPRKKTPMLGWLKKSPKVTEKLLKRSPKATGKILKRSPKATEKILKKFPKATGMTWVVKMRTMTDTVDVLLEMNHPGPLPVDVRKTIDDVMKARKAREDPMKDDDMRKSDIARKEDVTRMMTTGDVMRTTRKETVDQMENPRVVIVIANRRKRKTVEKTDPLAEKAPRPTRNTSIKGARSPNENITRARKRNPPRADPDLRSPPVDDNMCTRQGVVFSTQNNLNRGTETNF